MNSYAGLHCNDAEVRIKSLAITQSGEWSVTVNVTNDTIAEWEAIKNTDKWFEVYHPNLTKAWFIAAHIPDKLPLPAMGQNELLTMELSLVIKTYYGFGNAVAPTDSSGGSTT